MNSIKTVIPLINLQNNTGVESRKSCEGNTSYDDPILCYVQVYLYNESLTRHYMNI